MHVLKKIAFGLWLCAAVSAASAQVDKPVRVLVGFAPGGSADIAARLLADRMKDELKQPVVVENRPGAGGRIAAEAISNGPADGSTADARADRRARYWRRSSSRSCRTTRWSTLRRWRRWPTSSSACRWRPPIQPRPCRSWSTGGRRTSGWRISAAGARQPAAFLRRDDRRATPGSTWSMCRTTAAGR